MTTASTATARKLDIGSGMKIDGNYVRLDIAGEPEVFGDARLLPFADGSFDEVRLHHVLEHIAPGHDRIAVMNEVHRVLVDGGKADIEVPVFPYWPAIADPTHISFFVSQSFDYFHVDGPFTDHMHIYGILPWRPVRRYKPGGTGGDVMRTELEKTSWPTNGATP